MHGWAKRAKEIFGSECEVREIKDQSMEIWKGGELLVDAKRNAFGQMIDNQKESHAKYPLGALQDSSWKIPEEA